MVNLSGKLIKGDLLNASHYLLHHYTNSRPTLMKKIPLTPFTFTITLSSGTIRDKVPGFIFIQKKINTNFSHTLISLKAQVILHFIKIFVCFWFAPTPSKYLQLLLVPFSFLVTLNSIIVHSSRDLPHVHIISNGRKMMNYTITVMKMLHLTPILHAW